VKRRAASRRFIIDLPSNKLLMNERLLGEFESRHSVFLLETVVCVDLHMPTALRCLYPSNQSAPSSTGMCATDHSHRLSTSIHFNRWQFLSYLLLKLLILLGTRSSYSLELRNQESDPSMGNIEDSSMALISAKKELRKRMKSILSGISHDRISRQSKSVIYGKLNATLTRCSRQWSALPLFPARVYQSPVYKCVLVNAIG
jgi:hypothetical protein